MSPTQSPSARLALLDGMRGVAAIGVLLYHVSGVCVVRDGFSRGYLFVDFFFLFSGFSSPARRARKWPFRVDPSAFSMTGCTAFGR